MTQTQRSMRRRVLGALMLALGATGCDTSESAPPPPETQTPVAESTPALASEQVCVEVYFWAKGRTLCKPRGTSIDSLLSEFKPTQEALCNTFTDPELHSQCKSKPPYVFAPAGDSANPSIWVQRTEEVQGYFRMSLGASMAIYETSLEKMEGVGEDMVGPSQSELDRRNKRRTDARARVGDGLKARATAEQRAASTELATKRETLEEYKHHFASYQLALEALEPQVTTTLSSFVTYRDGEAAVFTQLEDISTRASAATLAQLGALQVELVDLSRTESQRPQQLQMDARRLVHAMGQIHARHLLATEPFSAFLAQNNLPRVNLTERSAIVLNNIASYADARYARVATAVAKLLEGMRLRRGALVTSQANAATRQTLATAATLKASEAFLANANQRTTALWQLPPRSRTLKYFFLAGKHVDFESILQLEPLCANVSTTSTPWMETGCIALRRQFTSARNYLNTTLPNMVRLNVTNMRRAGVSEALLVDVETHLNNANLRQAVLAHDVALRASDL